MAYYLARLQRTATRFADTATVAVLHAADWVLSRCGDATSAQRLAQQLDGADLLADREAEEEVSEPDPYSLDALYAVRDRQLKSQLQSWRSVSADGFPLAAALPDTPASSPDGAVRAAHPSSPGVGGTHWGFDDDGTLDELVTREATFVHLEALDSCAWYLVIDLANGDKWQIDLGAVDDGVKGYARAERIE